MKNRFYLIAFINCVVLALILSIAHIIEIVPPGEGAFGIAKAIPFIFVTTVLIVFCFFWFPANIAICLWFRLKRNSKLTPEPVIFISGFIFATALLFYGFYWLQLEHKMQSKNLPIEFYGKVIDQNNNPLPDAKIDIGIRHWKMADPTIQLAKSDTIYLKQTSDADGRFEFHGATGDGFGVGITKEGYELEQNKYSSGPTAGSIDNPVIFKMWSRNIHEQLITSNKSFHIVPDGKPYFIDLTTGTINQSGAGDLKVWIQYTNQVKDSQLHDWSAGITVINGGLQDAPDYVMWQAPADGYVPSFNESGQIKGYQTGKIGDRRFYIQLKNGSEYGHMTIDLIAPYNFGIPGLVRISYAINPSGSRILR